METSSVRGKTWRITVDFIETLAFAIVAGALASVALAGAVLVLSLSANAAEGKFRPQNVRAGTHLMIRKEGGARIAASLDAAALRVHGMQRVAV